MTEFFATTIAALVFALASWTSVVSHSTRGFLKHLGSRQIRIERPVQSPFPTPTTLSSATPVPSETPLATPTSTPATTPTSPSASPTSSPKTQPAASATPKPTPKPIPRLLQKQSTPAPTPAVTPPADTPTPIPSPDFTVGTLTITDYTKPSVKLGEPFPFKIFVRDTNDVIVKNKTLTVLVNDKAQFTSTDEAGKAPLEFSQTQSPGKVLVTVALGGKSTALEITVLDTKPSLASSPVGCSQDGCHIRLGSESGDWIPGWLVTAKAPADSAYLARTKTDALGLATFPLPPRSFDNPEYTYYICIDVESIGTKCGGF